MGPLTWVQYRPYSLLDISWPEQRKGVWIIYKEWKKGHRFRRSVLSEPTPFRQVVTAGEFVGTQTNYQKKYLSEETPIPAKFLQRFQQEVILKF